MISRYTMRMDNLNATAQIRFGLGLMPGQATEADPRGALKAQLLGADPGLASGAFDQLPTGRQAVDAIRADVVMRNAIRKQKLPLAGNFHAPTMAFRNADIAAHMNWAVTTPAGFRERLVWFWSNHFTVSLYEGDTAVLIGPMIREAIRPHVNGNFTDLVLAAERHPAMLLYLNNAHSIGPDSPIGIRSGKGLNENLGRECMELHTVGLAAGYSQTDVTNMAKILTGWSLAGTKDGGDETGFLYRPNTHEPGPQTVLGHSFDGGEQAGIDALTFLSKQPTAYRMIARQLVTHFVADDPPPDAVDNIAGVLMETGGDLAAASAALVDLPDAWQSLTKLKTPMEYVVSTIRAAPPPPDQPPVPYVQTLAQLGQLLWGALLPNGWPDEAAAWDSASAILARVDWAFTYAGRFENGDMGIQPSDIAATALGPLLNPATADAIANAGSRREAVTLLLSSPEFQRR